MVIEDGAVVGLVAVTDIRGAVMGDNEGPIDFDELESEGG